MIFKVYFDKTKKLKKDRDKLKKFPEIVVILKKIIIKLEINPLDNCLEIKKMSPKSANKFRVRIKNWRVIYSIDFGNKVILIHRINTRSEVYR